MRTLNRRQFIQTTAASGSLALAGMAVGAFGTPTSSSKIISPGCRKSKIKVARLYMGTSHGLWPKPNLDFEKEIKFYKAQFEKIKDEVSDVDFVVDELITSKEEVAALKTRIADVDGILAIHFNIGINPILEEILIADKPTMVFADPYSGHEWVGFGRMRNRELGAKMDCMLTSDYSQLAIAIRPFRAIHHLKAATILNVTTRSFEEYGIQVKEKFGTEIKRVELARVLDAYDSVKDGDAKRETEMWINNAEKVVEPSKEDIYKSCKLGLALEKLLDEENATLITVDCYGTMWEKGRGIKLPAYPCLGFTRLNNMGLGGICESDLRSAMTHILFQGLVGKPGFISDPTVDTSNNTIILAHCLGTNKMDGPNAPADPYKLRTIMERQEGVVPQVEMRVGEKVTQAIFIGTDLIPYFIGEIVDAPVGLEHDRGCRTKIIVNVDGDVEKLWKNWTNGLHRQTCYGDITKELGYFCRFMNIEMVNEAA